MLRCLEKAEILNQENFDQVKLIAQKPTYIQLTSEIKGDLQEIYQDDKIFQKSEPAKFLFDKIEDILTKNNLDKLKRHSSPEKFIKKLFNTIFTSDFDFKCTQEHFDRIYQSDTQLGAVKTSLLLGFTEAVPNRTLDGVMKTPCFIQVI